MLVDPTGSDFDVADGLGDGRSDVFDIGIRRGSEEMDLGMGSIGRGGRDVDLALCFCEESASCEKRGLGGREG